MKLAVDNDVWHEVARIALRYDEERDRLGDEFLDAVHDALGLIAERPEAWMVWPGLRPVTPPVRRYVMDRFPYVIGYQVVADADTIVVVAIAHAKRRPGAWR